MGGDWNEVTLGEISDFRAGSVFKPSHQGNADGEIPFIKVSDMNLSENAVRILSANNWVSKAAARDLRAKPLPPGAVVFAKIGEALRQNRLRQVVRDTIVDNNMMGAIPRRDRVDEGFFYYTLSQFDFAEIAQGTALPYLTVSSISNLKLNLPELHEQRAIAHILSSLDNKIELNRRMSATLETMARSHFKAWFVYFAPVRAKAEGHDPGLPPHLASVFPDRLIVTEHGEVPEGWEVKPLSEIAEFLNGLALQKYPATDPADSLPVIKIAELRNGVTAKSDRASRDVPDKYIVRDGDFLFSWSGSLLAKFWTEGDGALNQHLFKVSSDRYPTWFIAEWVQVHLEEFQNIAASKATTMGHIQRGHLNAAMTNCPPNSALADLGSVISPLVERRIQIDLESRTLVAIRDTFLPKLISGDLRVKDAETYLDRVL
jgi:type I restriction enzyme, S subunit